MTIIFESQIYPQEIESVLVSNSKSSVDFASHNFCYAIYDGLKANGVNVILVNTPNIGSYPILYKKPYVPSVKLCDGLSLGFLNLPYLKRHIIRNKVYKKFCDAIESCPASEKIVLLLYNFRSISILKKIKQCYPYVIICLIVTDLPQYMLYPKHFLFYIGRNFFNKKKCNSLTLDFSNIDGLVLLSHKMIEKLNLGDKPWIQIEGIYNSDVDVVKQSKPKERVVLYTGNLGLRYGIKCLLDAFRQIPDENYRLWICGSGEGKNLVLEYSRVDERIVYKGVLSRNDVIALQKQATILVNPRKSTDEYTKYSFPSKTMEYLASGTPLVMSRLSSFPQEYFPYIFYFENEDVDGFKSKMMEICSMPQCVLDDFGKKASDFIFKNKTPMPQMAKLINFINKL